MPQDRILLHSGTDLKVEYVRSLSVPTEWSPMYTAPSRRLVFPLGNTATDVRCSDEIWWMDGLTAMSLADALAYQLRPCTEEARCSLVVSGQSLSDRTSKPISYLLHPRALYRLHAASRQLRSGRLEAAAATSLVAEFGDLKVQIQPTGAVERARRLLSTTLLQASLYDIADATFSSPFHLARKFRRETCLSLHQYRQHLRLAAALKRLADEERDLAGLAHDLGYCSQSHLGAVFRREVGVTLGQARQVLSTRG